MVAITGTNRWLWLGLICGLLVVLPACKPADQPKPEAKNIAGHEIGYFCQMLVINHTGPKGQIHLRQQSEPLWFTSVRDTVAFTLLPGESKAIRAIYVNDMAHASLESSEPSSHWLDAEEAWFVLGSDALGGMGMPEAVPFASQSKADEFRRLRGGRVVRLADIQLEDVQ